MYRLRYDSLGRLTSVVDPGGNEHAQSYDLLGRVVAIDDPNAGHIELEYDAAGNLLSRTDARGETVRMRYDGANRVVARWDPSDEEGTTVSIRYDFDADCDECTNAAGREVSARYPLGELGDGADETGYDARGRAVFSARTIEGYRFVSRVAHDNLGRLTQSSYPDGQSLDYAYDDASRMTSIEGVIDDVVYDERGLLATIAHANGVHTEHTYDAKARLSSLRTMGPDDGILSGYDFERDRIGNLTSIGDLADPIAGRPSASASYRYDAWYRLVEATLGADAPETVSFEYDLLDNVLSRTSSLGAASRAHVGAYEYGSSRPNAVTRAGAHDYELDAAGFVTQRDARSYVWDHVGRLIEATEPQGGSGRFFYGSGPARVAKLEEGGATFYVGPDFVVQDGIANVYARLGDRRVARLRSDALQTALLSDVAPLGAPDERIDAADAWLAHAGASGIVDGVGEASDPMRILRGAARRLLLEDGEAVAHLHHDHLGSITLATGADGSVLGERLYYPNGEERFASGFTDERGFTGQERDESSGLLAFQFRHLDTAIGRWTSVDPAFLSLTAESVGRLGEATTSYAYVGGHFPNAADPTGLMLANTTRRVSASVMRSGGRMAQRSGRRSFTEGVDRERFETREDARKNLGRALARHGMAAEDIHATLESLPNFRGALTVRESTGERNEVWRTTDPGRQIGRYTAMQPGTRSGQAVLRDWSQRQITVSLDFPKGTFALVGEVEAQGHGAEHYEGGDTQLFIINNLNKARVTSERLATDRERYAMSPVAPPSREQP